MTALESLSSTSTTAESAHSTLPLQTLYSNGLLLYTQLEDSDKSTSDPAFQKDVETAILWFEKCWVKTQVNAIFSGNETVEDINTLDLRYCALHLVCAGTMNSIILPLVLDTS